MPRPPSKAHAHKSLLDIPEERAAIRQDAVTLYARGQSIRQVAAELKYSFATIRNLLQEAGTELRTQGGKPGPRG